MNQHGNASTITLADAGPAHGAERAVKVSLDLSTLLEQDDQAFRMDDPNGKETAISRHQPPAPVVDLCMRCAWEGCSEDGTIFAEQKDLIVHWNTKHLFALDTTTLGAEKQEVELKCRWKGCWRGVSSLTPASTFKTKQGLIDHVRIHTLEKPWMCPIKTCGAIFAIKSNCLAHSRMAHNRTLTKPLFVDLVTGITHIIDDGGQGPLPSPTTSTALHASQDDDHEGEMDEEDEMVNAPLAAVGARKRKVLVRESGYPSEIPPPSRQRRVEPRVVVIVSPPKPPLALLETASPALLRRLAVRLSKKQMNANRSLAELQERWEVISGLMSEGQRREVAAGVRGVQEGLAVSGDLLAKWY